MKEYRITLVIGLGILGMVILFAVVHSFILWLTDENTLALQWGVFACVAVFIALLVDLSRKPEKCLSEDLRPKGINSTAIPDEESLSEIPVENRIKYSPETVQNTEQSPSYNEINEYEIAKGVNT